MRARFGHLAIFWRVLELTVDRRSALFLNPPDHTRLRALVSKACTTRTVERLRSDIATLVDGLCDVIPTGEAVEAMEALAYRLQISSHGAVAIPSTTA